MSSPRELLAPYLEERSLYVSVSTVKDDRFHLQRFFRFLDRQNVTHVGTLNLDTLAAYQRYLQTVPGKRGKLASESYLYKSLCLPKLFLEWAFRNGLTLESVESFSLPHCTNPEPEIPTVEQVQKLLEAIDPSSPRGKRDSLILESFYTLGLRRRESHQLNLVDLNLAKQTLRVRGKNQRERLLPVSDRLCGLFSDYLKKGRPYLRPCPDEEALWVSQSNGTRLCYESLRNTVYRTAQKVGLSGIYPHLLRHACATHLLEAGAELSAIQAFLGHNSPDSTERYTHVSQQELQTVFGRCHPRASGGEPS